MQREGIFREMKLRGHYEKPSEKKAREKAEAIRRARKLARKRMQREGLLPMKPRSGARSAPTELLIDLRGGRPRPERGVNSDAARAFGPALSFWAVTRYAVIVDGNNDRREAGEDAR